MNNFKLNAEYAASFGAYWMIYAIAGSFASVFMLAKGYSNMQIGMTLAAANLVALALQPFIADHMDRVKGTRMIDMYGVRTMMLAAAAVTAAGAAVIILNVDKVKNHGRLPRE